MFFQEYEFEQWSLLRDALEPAVSLFVLYTVSTSLMEVGFEIDAVCFCLPRPFLFLNGK